MKKNEWNKKQDECSKKQQNREDEILEASWDLNARLGSLISARLQEGLDLFAKNFRYLQL